MVWRGNLQLHYSEQLLTKVEVASGGYLAAFTTTTICRNTEQQVIKLAAPPLTTHWGEKMF